MNERKKPGPKPKCKDCGRKEGEGHYDDCPVGLGVPAEVALVQAEMRRGAELAVLGSSDINPSQEYAMRVWEGQSESADRPWRIERVKTALEAQGLPFEGVELP